MKLAVYCSGSIQKGPSDVGKLCWTDRERSEVASGARPIDLIFLQPDDPAEDLDDTESLFGRDMYQVKVADAVIVDARERRGIGIGIEMLASRMLGTPLIVVAPDNSYYKMRRVSYRGSTVDNYVHPHLAILADAIVNTFEEAGRCLRHHINEPIHAKSTNAVMECMAAYKLRMLPRDSSMMRILDHLQKKD